MSDSDTKASDRPTTGPKIEITPEMLDAGAVELLSYDPRYEKAEEAAERVFLVMFERFKGVSKV